MKINKASLKQTSLTCPSSWAGLSDDGKQIEIYFRRGKLELRLEGRVVAEGERDQFDISSFMELEDALLILGKRGVESE